MATDFDVRKDTRGQWYWTFQAENNKTIARSSESYFTRSDCLHSIKLVKSLAPACPVYDLTGEKAERVATLP